MYTFVRKIRGEATAFLDLSRKMGWVDFLVLLGIIGLIMGLVSVASEWRQPITTTQAPIDLSLWALPRYTFYSLARGVIAYILSLIFTIVYGYWAAKDEVAQRILIPLLDILQSIPVLSFLPGLVLALVSLFPDSTTGLELAAVLAIFSAQAWNMTFSFYHSLRSVPSDQREAAKVYRFNWWEQFKWVELPFSTMGLVWNSMMSMAGGWFFLMISETITVRGKDQRLPGIGSYMSAANDADDTTARIWAIVAMTLMIVMLDQFFWRPVVVWAQKFRVEEGGQVDASSSWFLDWLRHSRIWLWFGKLFSRPAVARPPVVESAIKSAPSKAKSNSAWAGVLGTLLFIGLLAFLGYGAFKIIVLMMEVPLQKWLDILIAAVWTLGRVLISIAVGTLWAVPAGLAIGLSPKLSRIFQPVVQVVASFPAPMLFAIVIGGVLAVHRALAGSASSDMEKSALDWGSVLLMLLGTQWYILFNMIAGAMAVPADLREAARSFGLTPSQRFWKLYLPACFPYLVTGWVTAAGGAWNASIVAEYVIYKKSPIEVHHGLGAIISAAAADVPVANAPVLAAATVVMSVMVILFNRLVWRRFYALAETKYSLSK